MLSPGAKGWISKYADLLEKGELDLTIQKPIGIGKAHFMHLKLSQSGIVFGFAAELIFAQKFNNPKWTNEERLKLLLFESLYFVYRLESPKNASFEDFITLLMEFYKQHNSKSITNLFTFFIKESNVERLENILTKRTDIRTNLLENAIWVNHLSNSFVYLDVVLFQEFLQNNQFTLDISYGDLAINALKTISLSANSDDTIDQKERRLFEVFLASANLSDRRKEAAVSYFKSKNGSLDDLEITENTSWLFRRFLLDLAVLTIYANYEPEYEEIRFLQNLCKRVRISSKEMDETLVMVEQFVLKNSAEISFLMDANRVEKLYTNASKRWIKILGRNKDKLAAELQQSKELVFLIKKSTTVELTKEEKEKVKTQFMDIVKSMPALAIFMLPGGVVLLPMVLKIIPTLIPSAFRENEIDRNE